MRVIAPDRPGLMRDITRALAREGFFIDSASISTKDDQSDNVFAIKLPSREARVEASEPADGPADADSFSKTMFREVETLVVEAALDAWAPVSTESNPIKKMQYLAPEDRKVAARVAATVVESSLTRSGKCVMVSVVATDRSGLLAATTEALHEIGCGIIAATISTTKEGIANNQFVVAVPEKCNAEKVRMACLRVAEK